MSDPFHGIIEVNYDPAREIMKGLKSYRNLFCDVRLWVENHAIPAHKLILSLHSTFFQQMFKSESESASEVYLNDVRYNVLYPIVEFMYTGRAYIDSTDVFDEIKAFSRNINFHPFCSLWNDNNAQSVAPSLLTQTPEIDRPLAPASTSSVQSMSPYSFDRNIIASTCVTTCLPSTQMSSSFAPALASTPVSTNNFCSTRSIPVTPLDSMLYDSRYTPTTPARVNLVSTLACSPSSGVVSPTPPRAVPPLSLLSLPSPPLKHRFLGFLPGDITNCGGAGDYTNAQVTSRNGTTSISLRTKIPVNRNVSPSIIELSDISQVSRNNDSNNNDVIEIDETEIEGTPQMASGTPNRIQFSAPNVEDINLIVAKPKPRRGRPKRATDSADDKLFVSTASLFKKTRQSQRGRKRKNLK